MTNSIYQGSGVCGIVLAAGRGTRMGGHTPKVLLKIGGIPMVRRVVETLRQASVFPVCVVVSPGAHGVRDELTDLAVFAEQEQPRGSGDAAAAARPVVGNLGAEDIVVACGDSPLFTKDTVVSLIDTHRKTGAVVSLTSANLADPTGYGRIVRSEDGNVEGIIEEAVASQSVKAISEVNGGLYVFDARWLWEQLAIRRDQTNEFVLTEIVHQAAASGATVAAVECDPDEIAGVNTPDQLACAEAILSSRSGA